MVSIIEEIVDLRVSQMHKMRGIQKSPQLHSHVRKYFETIYSYRTEEPILVHSGHRLVASILVSRYYHGFYKCLLNHMHIDCSEGYEPEVSRMLASISTRGTHFLELNSYQSIVKSYLGSHKILASTYGGDTDLSYKKLLSSSPKCFSELNLECQIASSLAQVKSAFAIKKEAFDQDESRCWFWKHDGFQQSEEDRMQESMQRGELLVLLQDKLVCGYACLQVNRNSPYWGPSCGIDIGLASHLRSQGLSYTLYLEILSLLQSKKIPFFIGTTMNPSVLRLAKRLQRWLISDQISVTLQK